MWLCHKFTEGKDIKKESKGKKGGEQHKIKPYNPDRLKAPVSGIQKLNNMNIIQLGSKQWTVCYWGRRGKLLLPKGQQRTNDPTYV